MKIINVNSSKYPVLLKKIEQPPAKLYYKGKWDRTIFENCLAVVGSRKMTRYGKQVTDYLISKLASAGLTIVSGFMYGVDAQAHRAALTGRGRTIAVMPCGIDLIHPAYQGKLYKQILDENGLIISELPGDMQPALWTYPRRNRIVAGLSRATLVIEAGLNSGSLITAGLTRRFSRKLFAVPGPVTSSVSEGTLALIKEGAEMVTGAEGILAYYSIKNHKMPGESIIPANLSGLEKKIVQRLMQEPLEVDALSRRINVSFSKLSTALSFMELKGLVQQAEGKYHVSTS